MDGMEFGHTTKCLIVMYRHVVRCGGTSVRVAFHRLELNVGHWAALGRSEAISGPCRRTQWVLNKQEGLQRFLSCAANQRSAEDAAGWSIEYHVPNDGAERFAADSHAVSAYRPPYDLAYLMQWVLQPQVARALTVLVVRRPVEWFRSQWLHPEMRAAHWSHQYRSNVTSAILGMRMNPQWHEVVRGSGFVNRTHTMAACRLGLYDDGRPAVPCVLREFDIVGVTDQIGDLMLLVCRIAGMAVCPPIAHDNRRSENSSYAEGSCRTGRPPQACWPLGAVC